MQKSIAGQETTTKQRRHARSTRWIATLAVAGTAACCGAAAAQAAADAGQASGQSASPTCASMQSDFNSTLLQAAKNLLATPPAMDTATNQVSHANALYNTMNGLNCAKPEQNTTAATPVAAAKPVADTTTATPGQSELGAAAPNQQPATSGRAAAGNGAAGELPKDIYFGAPLMRNPANTSQLGDDNEANDMNDAMAPLSAADF